ncbi:DUF2917 domain-containing protein [Glaciimonas immobilis]|uniref:Quercetin dioxygenase-like cupin family protein n=1 Tax=Glaciimonas immobilis TaxID=728004 RepID=A0A840RTW9_9BURK|nr:DUF2917 domain-containing protein [Glaciimonas immobilis]KAF3997125.1 DUF2917 domain-containing protein [Glaciimonas immobilis]MBB5199990.1 quercetin dioxygenase-like cupin family protein [Glaciimonas immobilis]
MRALFTKGIEQSLALNAGQVLSMQAKRAETLQVTSGRVWVTISGERDDYWLSAGDHLNVAAGSRIVLEADQGQSVVKVQLQKPAVSRVVTSGRMPVAVQVH